MILFQVQTHDQLSCTAAILIPGSRVTVPQKGEVVVTLPITATIVMITETGHRITEITVNQSTENEITEVQIIESTGVGTETVTGIGIAPVTDVREAERNEESAATETGKKDTDRESVIPLRGIVIVIVTEIGNVPGETGIGTGTGNVIAEAKETTESGSVKMITVARVPTMSMSIVSMGRRWKGFTTNRNLLTTP